MKETDISFQELTLFQKDQGLNALNLAGQVSTAATAHNPRWGEDSQRS